MEERIIGKVRRVNGPVIEAQDIDDAMMMELVHVGESRLVGEIVKLADKRAVVQVYEDTTGIAPGDPVYGSGMPLSVELGPGLMGEIYDGIQRPLVKIREECGVYIERGIEEPPLSRSTRWKFVPLLKAGDRVEEGQVIGTVQESEKVEHRILCPKGYTGELKTIVQEGSYTVDERVAEIRLDGDSSGDPPKAVTMVQRWPIRVPRPVGERRFLEIPLVTGQRVIDTLFPLAKGGTVAIPGGFGTGKTMTQHAVAKWCDADIILYIGCGERGNEMTDVLKEFPQL
ncbi:MAG: V-type ATP synthase subunit A, partial [Spirochaetia bacterium]